MQNEPVFRETKYLQNLSLYTFVYAYWVQGVFRNI